MTQEPKTNDELTEQELDALDASLLEIELLYKSRCVSVPKGSNVVVREIDATDK